MSALASFAGVAARMAMQRKARSARGEALVGNFQIDKGIPIPPRTGRGGAPLKGYTAVLRRLQRGDSVRLPLAQAAAGCLALRILGSGCFVTRAEGGHTRVWRIK